MRAHSSRVPAGPAYASHPPPPPADVLTYVEVLQRHCQDNGFELPVMPPREYAAYDEQVVGGAGGGGGGQGSVGGGGVQGDSSVGGNWGVGGDWGWAPIGLAYLLSGVHPPACAGSRQGPA
jgi:hypothetical protein